MRIPLEILEQIFLALPTTQQYILGTLFRLRRIQVSGLRGIPNLSINNASRRDLPNLLEFWKHGVNLNVLGELYDESAVNFASASGNLSVLEWWLKNFDELKVLYDDHALEFAAENGRMEVLEWWRSSNLELKFSEKLFDDAWRRGDVNVVRWLLSNGFPVNEITDRVGFVLIDSVCELGYYQLLDVFYASEMEFDYSDHAVISACEFGHLEVLEWFWNSGLEVNWSFDALFAAVACGRCEVLDWWVKHGLVVVGAKELFDFAWENGIGGSVDWLLRYECERRARKEMEFSEQMDDMMEIAEPSTTGFVSAGIQVNVGF
ncbi:hypothetical protein HK098_000665 [Nowakowskiella sp. JEL0407]|nr:hypothetical protein HK098_000665 [Nowakowskiella sp. JEL0407]